MAYNLQPLIQILEHILDPHSHRRPNWILDPCKKPVIESLLVKARFLNEFFENPSSLTAHAVERLESRIRDATYHAQNLIESHLADLLLSNEYSKIITFTPPDLLQEIHDREFVPVCDQVVDIMDGRDMGIGPSSTDLVSSSEDLNPKNIVVGIGKDAIQLKEQLIMPQESKLEIVPIVGMGGIGKTTLAQTLYDDQLVVSYFDTRAWITISQSYSEREMFLGLLKCIIGNSSNKVIVSDGNDELGLQLHKLLWGRRYLIVLDDMWSSEAWDCIRNYFPDGNNGSRILMTTREQNVANCVASAKNLHHQMKLLDEVESWNLLRQKVFSDGRCALELDEVGKNIAKDCRGLPLAIHVVGGVLARLEQTQKAWMQVAKDIRSFVSHGQISNILALSFNHLPNYLKPCFLYMGAFPEGRHIQASKLIRLWMAEGFLKPISGMSFEETARVYLKELVERNLLSVGKLETKRKAKGYIMHDLLRDLCISKAREENFLCVGIDDIKDLNPNEMPRLRLRLSVHGSFDQFTHIIGTPCIPSGVCSILLFAEARARELSWLDKYAFGLRLLKVLDILEANLEKVPKAVERLVNLRYLAINAFAGAFSIFNLRNLQTVILRIGYGVGKVNVNEFLDMPQLQHIKFLKGGPYPLIVLKDGEDVSVVNEGLQTLSRVYIDDSFPRILTAIPNLKKLGISCNFVSSTIDLSYVSQLQILWCSALPWLGVSHSHKIVIFPLSLQKLTLQSCKISSEFLNEIGHLPNLQVFKVKNCELAEEDKGEWKPSEGEFQQLRLLQLEYFSGLKKWIADETHYPRLEHLIIRVCGHLEEIPSGIGYILTLEIIEVVLNAASVDASARKIKEEQIQYGNDTLQVRITTGSKELAALEAEGAALEAKGAALEAEGAAIEAEAEAEGAALEAEGAALETEGAEGAAIEAEGAAIALRRATEERKRATEVVKRAREETERTTKEKERATEVVKRAREERERTTGEKKRATEKRERATEEGKEQG